MYLLHRLETQNALVVFHLPGRKDEGLPPQAEPSPLRDASAMADFKASKFLETAAESRL